jgi:small GTP-binding protein
MAVTLADYESTMFTLADILRSAGFILQQTDVEASAECQRLLKRIAENRFNVVVAGRFSRGKSTLLNAILGSNYLPTGIVPLTSVITAVRFGNRERAVLEYENSGIPQEVRLAALPGYITEEGNPGNRRRIRSASLEVPSEILRHDYFFVDTPGLASAILENTQTTERFLPEIDALILVTSFEGPLSQDEIAFLEKTAGFGVRRIFLVMNKSDLASPEEREEALRFVRQRCAELRFEELPIFPVSARLGLDAKKTRDSRALVHSGIHELEDQLVRFLTRDKSREFLSRLFERTLALLGSWAGDTKIDGLLARTRELAQQVSSETADGEAKHPREPSGRAMPAGAPDPPRPCRVCAEILQHVLDYFTQFQLAVSTDESTRLAHVRSRGLCSFHTWQYEGLASPRGICTGYFPLLLSLSEYLQRLAASTAAMPDLRRELLACLATHSRCPACKVRADAEDESLRKIRSALQTSGTASRGPAICLPHLLRLTMEINDREAANHLLLKEAASLRRIAEGMQRYALREDSQRRDLISEEEQLSYRFALHYLAGNKHVDALWFADALQKTIGS